MNFRLYSFSKRCNIVCGCGCHLLAGRWFISTSNATFAIKNRIQHNYSSKHARAHKTTQHYRCHFDLASAEFQLPCVCSKGMMPGVRSRLHSFIEKSDSPEVSKKPVLRVFKIDESLGDLSGAYADSAPPPSAPAPAPAPPTHTCCSCACSCCPSSCYLYNRRRPPKGFPSQASSTRRPVLTLETIHPGNQR